MDNLRSRALFALCLLAIYCICICEAAPQNQRGRGGGERKQTPRDKATAKSEGFTQFQFDGQTMMILDQTVDINGLPIRFKVSAPAQQFTQESGVQGASAQPNTEGPNGVNVLLHGDGGQSFDDFPNKSIRGDLMGVALLAPDPQLHWGGGNGLDRTDGIAHSQAVADFVTDMLTQIVAFNQSQVFFMGVSGGSLLLSGFFMPQQMGKFPNGGVQLNCGAMKPQVQVNAESSQALRAIRIHFQSTKDELPDLKKSIPQSIKAYEDLVTQDGLGAQDINSLQTADSSPNGGHCEFDGKDFTTGVRAMADSFQNVMLPNSNGEVPEIGNVNTGVVGQENLKFGQSTQQGNINQGSQRAQGNQGKQGKKGRQGKQGN